MIVYKYVVKRLGQYYPLINFGIDGGKIRNCPRYKLNEVYSNPIDFNTIKPYRGRKTMLDHYVGYHFFKNVASKGYNTPCYHRVKGNIYIDWLNYFKRTLNKNIKITILKCEVKKSYIIAENENRIVAKKFKILKEIY